MMHTIDYSYDKIFSDTQVPSEWGESDPCYIINSEVCCDAQKITEIIYVLSSGGEIEKFQYCSSQSGCCSELQSRSLVYADVIVTLNPESFWTGVMHALYNIC